MLQRFVSAAQLHPVHMHGECEAVSKRCDIDCQNICQVMLVRMALFGCNA